MKVTFEKAKLLAALLPAAGISQVKNTITTVEGLLFECPPRDKYGKMECDPAHTCRISAYDLEKGLQTTVECDIEEEGIYVIHTSKILQIVRVLPEGEITLAVDERGRVRVSGGQSAFEITAQNGLDFPTMPMFIGDRRYIVPQRCIRDILNRTVFAVGQNDPRPAFNGALLRIRDGWLTVAASDGNRLALARTALLPGAPDAEMVIPGKYLNELAKMLRDSEEEMMILLGRRHFICKIDNIYFFTRMIDAEFMKYERVLPQTYRLQAYLSARELTGAVERAQLIAEDKLGGNSRPFVKLTFEKESGSVSISSVSSGGSVFERLPCAIEGEDLTIGFNCRLLADALHALPEDAERLRLQLNTPLMGMVLEEAEGSGFLNARPDPEVFGERTQDTAVPDQEKDAFLYIIMPTRMNK